MIDGVSVDNLGFVWFINSGHLCRFDGIEFEYFGNTETKKGFYAFAPGKLRFTRHGVVFRGEGFFYYFNNGKFYEFPNRNSGLVSYNKNVSGLNNSTFELLDNSFRSLVGDFEKGVGLLYSLDNNLNIKVDTIDFHMGIGDYMQAI
ncbi:MAG: hypothetical protein IPO32_20540 [Crocinitomicaceae bacterium]|nr:hypothetical protein [Crocinitomicaceae bacterium]